MWFAYGETVTIQRARRIVDPYDPDAVSLDWSDQTETPVSGCAVWMTATSEPAELGRDAVHSDFTVILPTGTDVTAQDRLLIRGQVCEVAAAPFSWRNPFTGWEPGIEVRANIVEG